MLPSSHLPPDVLEVTGVGKLTHTYLYRASVGLGLSNGSIPNGGAGNIPSSSRLQVPGPCIQVQKVQSDRLSAVLMVSTSSFPLFSPSHVALHLHWVALSAEEGTEGICRRASVVSWHLEETSVPLITSLKPKCLWVKYGHWMTKEIFLPHIQT